MSKEKLKDFQKAWKTIPQDHFKNSQESLDPLRHYKKMRVGSRHLNSTLFDR